MGASIRSAQRLLLSVDPTLAVDGIWGRRTQAAFDAASQSLKAYVTAVFTDEGKVPPWGSRWISERDASSLVYRAAAEAGLSEHVAAFDAFLRLEAAQRRRADGSLEFNVNSRNGGSRGLMQMQRAAWEDARKMVPSLRDYDAVFDPYQNILAGIAYAKFNIKGMEKRGVPINGNNLYLAHNQGLGYFSGARTAVGNQSKTVQRMISGQKVIG